MRAVLGSLLYFLFVQILLHCHEQLQRHWHCIVRPTLETPRSPFSVLVFFNPRRNRPNARTCPAQRQRPLLHLISDPNGFVHMTNNWLVRKTVSSASVLENTRVFSILESYSLSLSAQVYSCLTRPAPIRKVQISGQLDRSIQIFVRPVAQLDIGIGLPLVIARVRVAPALDT